MPAGRFSVESGQPGRRRQTQGRWAAVDQRMSSAGLTVPLTGRRLRLATSAQLPRNGGQQIANLQCLTCNSWPLWNCCIMCGHQGSSCPYLSMCTSLLVRNPSWGYDGRRRIRSCAAFSRRRRERHKGPRSPRWGKVHQLGHDYSAEVHACRNLHRARPGCPHRPLPGWNGHARRCHLGIRPAHVSRRLLWSGRGLLEKRYDLARRWHRDLSSGLGMASCRLLAPQAI